MEESAGALETRQLALEVDPGSYASAEGVDRPPLSVEPDRFRPALTTERWEGGDGQVQYLILTCAVGHHHRESLERGQ
jgi:hypothetical protein